MLPLLVVASAAQAAVTSISPASDVLAGGTTVVITGTSLGSANGASGVTFGGVNATSYVVDSATRITAVVPAGTLGKKDVVVNGGGGTGTNLFTYKTSNTAALIINVQCTIARILSIVWSANTQTGGTPQTDGATGVLTWTLPAMVMDQIKTTIALAQDAPYGTNGIDFEIRNAGNSTIALTGTVLDQTAPIWTAAAATGTISQYYMAYALTINPVSPTWVSLDTGPVLSSNMAIDAVLPFELKFQAPSALAAAGFGVQHVIAVTMTATAGP